MQVNSVSSVSFNGKFSSVKRTFQIPLDGQPRKAHETIYYKKGLPYVWGQIKNIFNLLIGKKNAPNGAILSTKVVIPDYRIVNKQGMIDVVPKSVYGEFNMRNGNNVIYASEQRGITYVSIRNPKKRNIDIVLNGGKKQGTDSAEIKHLMELIQEITGEINSGSGKLEKETSELIAKLWPMKSKKN